jgi:hypothetical protein
MQEDTTDGAVTLGIMAFNTSLFETLSITVSSAIMLSVVFIVTPNVIMLSVVKVTWRCKGFQDNGMNRQVNSYKLFYNKV